MRTFIFRRFRRYSALIITMLNECVRSPDRGAARAFACERPHVPSHRALGHGRLSGRCPDGKRSRTLKDMPTPVPHVPLQKSRRPIHPLRHEPARAPRTSQWGGRRNRRRRAGASLRRGRARPDCVPAMPIPARAFFNPTIRSNTPDVRLTRPPRVVLVPLFVGFGQNDGRFAQRSIGECTAAKSPPLV